MEVDFYLKAGKVAKEVKDYSISIIKPGMKLVDIAKKIDEKILSLGAKPAFPVNLCLNEVAAHYTPNLNDDLKAFGILKVDIGIHIEGFIADTAFSVDLTEDSKFRQMIILNKKILEKVKESLYPGFEARLIGEVCQGVIERFNLENGTNFSTIKSLSGHELSRFRIHAGLTFSNSRNENRRKIDNMAFAIEPFLTEGFGDVYEGVGGNIFVLRNDYGARDNNSKELLSFIKKEYGTLPFCKRWLEEKGFQKLDFTLSNLKKQNIIYEYPILVEKSKSPVSQFEETFVVFDGKIRCITC